MTQAIKLPYQPREAFLPFHRRTERWALMVCHRRAGKTVACVNELVVRGLHTQKKNARYAYVAPFRQQAKEIAWTYLKEATEGIRVGNPRESELRVKLPNDVWVTLYGADNPDALRGLYFDGIILDEFGDMKPSLMSEVILPCLADREGWLALIGTAKGRNQFYDYKRKAANDPLWYHYVLRASESGIIPDSELKMLRASMDEDQYEQEMECSFDAALQGTYYADLVNKADREGRLVTGDCLYEPGQMVHVAADVGLRDSTAWWFWQPRADGIAVVDYHEAHGQHVDYYLKMLHEKGYRYKEIWLPHDAKAKTLATRRSTVEQFRNPSMIVPELYEDGYILPIRLTPKLSIQHGIDAGRQFLKRAYVDMDNCESGMDAMRSYRRQWHEHTKSFSDTPLHDWSSNGADAWRYMAIVAKDSAPQMSLDSTPAAVPDFSRPASYTLEQLYKDHEHGKQRGRIIRI